MNSPKDPDCFVHWLATQWICGVPAVWNDESVWDSVLKSDDGPPKERVMSAEKDVWIDHPSRPLRSLGP